MRWAIGSLMVLGTLPALADEKAEAPIRRAIVAAGGADVLNRYPAGRVTARGTLFDGGAEIAVKVEQAYHLPGRCRTVIAAEPRGQKLVLMQVMNDGKARQTVNGVFVPLTEATTRELNTALALINVGQLTPLLTDVRYMLKAEKTGVLVQVRGSPDLHLSFDRQTGHLVRVSRKFADPDAAKEVDLEQLFGDFKVVEGITRPTRVVVFKDGRKSLELTTESFTPLEKIDPKEFVIED